MKAHDSEILWKAVSERDARFDGLLYYAVKTTGIYCRPTCPSRRPHRGNVLFFATNSAAETSGFRPCKRCTPTTGDFVSPDQARVAAACRLLEEGDAPLPLDVLAARLALSERHLRAVFDNVLGISPSRFREALRLARLRRALRTADTVTEAIYSAGYGSASRAYDGITRKLGMTPGQYREGGRGQTLYCGLIETPLGLLLVAATSKGLCHVSLGDSESILFDTLRQEFPHAVITGANAQLEGWSQDLLTYLEGRAPWPQLPTDIRATAFQAAVWERLRAIPAGTTMSYSALARDLGLPNATRAVARACASNRLALVIPCHRVVAKAGGLAGYRWGIARKEALLTLESLDQESLQRPQVSRKSFK